MCNITLQKCPFHDEEKLHILTAVVERSGPESWESVYIRYDDSHGMHRGASLSSSEKWGTLFEMFSSDVRCLERAPLERSPVCSFFPLQASLVLRRRYYSGAPTLFLESGSTQTTHFFSSFSLLTACCSAVRREPLLVLVPLDGSCVEEVSHCVVLAITTSQVISKTTSTSPYVLQTQSSSTYHFCKKLSACLL